MLRAIHTNGVITDKINGVIVGNGTGTHIHRHHSLLIKSKSTIINTFAVINIHGISAVWSIINGNYAVCPVHNLSAVTICIHTIRVVRINNNLPAVCSCSSRRFHTISSITWYVNHSTVGNFATIALSQHTRRIRCHNINLVFIISHTVSGYGHTGRIRCGSLNIYNTFIHGTILRVSSRSTAFGAHTDRIFTLNGNGSGCFVGSIGTDAGHTGTSWWVHGYGVGINTFTVSRINTIRIIAGYINSTIIPCRSNSVTFHTIRRLTVNCNCCPCMVGHGGTFIRHGRSIRISTRPHTDTAVI